MNLDFNAIANLIEVSEKCELTELSIEYDGVKIEIKRDKNDSCILPSPQKNIVEQIIHVPVEEKEFDTKVIEQAPPEKKTVTEDENKYSKVLSPLVGVFYRAPWPGAKSFVELGDKVSPGQTLCIVEAMKLMNEIVSEVAGTVVKICVNNEEVVQSGEVLFLIDPS